MSEFQIEEKKPDHHFRTEIPNIILEWLEGETLIVYLFLKKTCGDSGASWKSVKTLSEESKISERQIRYSIKELSTPTQNRPALIEIKKRKNSNGSSDTNLITIEDVWRLNGDYYRNKKLNRGTAQHAGGVLHNMQGGTAPCAAKEEPYKKNQGEEEQQQPPTPLKGEAVVDECNKKFNNESDLEFTYPNRSKGSISVSRIFSAIIGMPYTNEEILEAITKARNAKAIRDPIEYIKGILRDSKSSKSNNNTQLPKNAPWKETTEFENQNEKFKWNTNHKYPAQNTSKSAKDIMEQVYQN